MVAAKKGFTLLEVVLVVSLVSVLSVVAGRSVVAILSSYHQAAVNTRIEETGHHALSIFESRVRAASSYSISPDQKQLTVVASDGTVEVFELVLVGDCETAGNSYLSFAGNSLTPQDAINGVNVDYAASSFDDSSGMVQFVLRLTQACAVSTRQEEQASETFTTSARPRSIYVN